MQSYEEIRGTVMRGWLKQGPKLILSVAISVITVCPTIGFSEEMINQAPTNFEMAADAVLVRPLLVVASAVGTALFIVTLPFSIIGGNVSEAADVLVVQPVDGLMFRCLGCTKQEDIARDRQHLDDVKDREAADKLARAAKEEAEAAAQASGK